MCRLEVETETEEGSADFGGGVVAVVDIEQTVVVAAEELELLEAEGQAEGGTDVERLEVEVAGVVGEPVALGGAANTDNIAFILGLAHKGVAELGTGEEGEADLARWCDGVVEQQGDINADESGGVLAACQTVEAAFAALGAVTQLSAYREVESAADGHVVVNAQEEAVEVDTVATGSPNFGRVACMDVLCTDLASKEKAGRKDCDGEKFLHDKILFDVNVIDFRGLSQCRQKVRWSFGKYYRIC